MPRKPRSQVIDPTHTCLHHIFTRCTRRLFLLADDQDERKQYVARVLGLLVAHFAIEVGSYSFMDNHVHLVVRMDPKDAERWTPREVVLRWGACHLPHGRPPTEKWIEDRLKDRQWVEERRKALTSISQLMKDFKQRITQHINRVEGTRGTVWEGRFGCRPIESMEDLIGASAYVDLNPFAAGLVDEPERARFTSLFERHAKLEGEPAPATVPFIGLAPMGDSGRMPVLDMSPAHKGQPLVRGGSDRDYLDLVKALARSLRSGVEQATEAARTCAARLGADVGRILERIRTMLEDPRLSPT